MPLPLPPIPMPSIPDWLKIAGEVLRLYSKRASKKGGGGDDEDECTKRMSEEGRRCGARKKEYAHPDFLSACYDRAKTRGDLCYRNGHRFPALEPPEWGPADEEVWFNENR
jgi:hypothetical protein